MPTRHFTNNERAIITAALNHYRWLRSGDNYTRQLIDGIIRDGWLPDPEPRGDDLAGGAR